MFDSICLFPSWSPASRPPAATCLWPNRDPTASTTASRPPTLKSRGVSPPITNRDVTVNKVSPNKALLVYYKCGNTVYFACFSSCGAKCPFVELKENRAHSSDSAVSLPPHKGRFLSVALLSA